jgi:16S rRNA processing protein RimM
VLGTVTKAIGLRGEVRLRATADFWEEALESAALSLRAAQGDQPVAVETHRAHGGGMWVVGFAGTQDRDAAEALVGRELAIDTEALDVAAPETLRPFQVRGLRVVHVNGTPIGEVVDLLAMPAQDLLVVRAGAREHWIPAVAPIVRRIDWDTRQIDVDPPDGLLEM